MSDVWWYILGAILLDIVALAVWMILVELAGDRRSRKVWAKYTGDPAPPGTSDGV
jgi:hypothetical protein